MNNFEQIFNFYYRSSPEEDEGFIDELSEPKKSVQFKTQVMEIPMLDDIKSHKTVLPPLEGATNRSPKRSPSKIKKNREKSPEKSPKKRKDDSVHKKSYIER